MRNVEKSYERRKDAYERLVARLTKTVSLISNLRLAVFLTGTAVSIFLYLTRNYILLTGVGLAFLILFIHLVVKHNHAEKQKRYAAYLSIINEQSIKRIWGEWVHFTEAGEDFIDPDHSFSYDLDIFGQDSLYQLVCTACTYVGREELRNLLIRQRLNVSEIYLRQEAIEELAEKLGWRQRFLSEGMNISSKRQNPEDLIKWAAERYAFFRNPQVIMGLRIVPAITIGLILGGWVLHAVPYYVPVILLLIQFILLGINRKERYQIFSLADRYKEDIKVYYQMLKHFEKHPFRSELLKEIKNSMMDMDGRTAFSQIDELVKIVDATTNRYNAYYHVFNILTLWDYQYIIRLEKWKEKSGTCLKKWLEGIGKLEALSSLATLRYDHAEWVAPEIENDAKSTFNAAGMAHPLLTGNRGSNDLNLQPPMKVILITGSNMSGKSTYLRTAGINLVLAYAGAPVCAKSFRVSLMDIYTCMRVSDNLGKSISSFYAELIKIKTIVAEANAGKTVFFLLDEIFKGTNSVDRHAGASVLIKKLSETNSIGLVSTHDLELSELEEGNPKIKNYHFREYYEGDSIRFDYKLQPGPSTTRNAIYLMKMAGIEF